MGLRPYQLEALEASKTKYSNHVNRQLLKLPTGMGKTVVFASIPDYFKFDKRVMVLVHREELANQAQDKLKKWNPNRTIGIEMADKEATNEDIIVASVATVGRKGSNRLQKYKPEDFDALIIDEAHHSTGITYTNTLNHFDFNNNGDRLLLGVTATVNRADGKGLGDIYQEIIYDYPLIRGISEGWLVDLCGIKVQSKSNLDNVHNQLGDFNLSELSDAVNTEARNDVVVKGWLEHGQNRQTVAFTVDIQHAQDLARKFKEHGIVGEAIWGNDPDREEKLKAHRSGSIKVLTNCNILTEGYDDWTIGCIILARPTKSETLYTQIIGRGTRIPDGITNLVDARNSGISISKEDCILLDVVDVTSKHSLITLPSLFGLNKDADLKGKTISYVMKEIENLANKKPNIDNTKIIDLGNIQTYAEKVDLFRAVFEPEVIQFSEYQWFKVGQNRYRISLPVGDRVTIEKDLLDKHHVKGEVLGTKIEDSFGTFQDAVKFADDVIRNLGGKSTATLLKREANWHKDPPTPAQLAIFKRRGIHVPEGITKGDASKRIAKLFAELEDSRHARYKTKQKEVDKPIEIEIQ